MYARPTARLAVAAIALLALAGCAQASPGAGSTSDGGTVDLRGEWRLTDGSTADGALTVPDFALTAVFTEGSARIRTGCISYDIDMTTDLDVQTASFVTSTVDANPTASCLAMDPSIDAATQSLASLTGASRDGDRLVLTGPELELDFELVPAVTSAELEGDWTLSSVFMSDIAMGVENGPTFSYADGQVSGTLGCDDYTGTLEPVSGNNTVTDLEITPSGDVCTMELRTDVEDLKNLLQSKFLIHTGDSSLELVSSTEDKRLSFSANA